MNAKKLFSAAVCVLFISAIFLTITAEAQQRPMKARENFITLWLMKMTQVLDLSEEQTAKIYPAVHRTEKAKIAIQKEIAKKIRELKFALSREKPEDQVLVDLIKDIKKLRNQVKAKDEELESLIEKNLTVEQRAKYIVFAVEFMRGIRDRLNKARMRQQRRFPDKRRFQK